MQRLFLAFLIFACARAFASDVADQSIGPAVKYASVGKDFWTWKLATLGGDTVVTQSLKGRYILINFWGEWCATCVQEIPFMVNLNNKYGRGKLVMLSFLKSADVAKAKKMIAQDNLSWPQIPLSDAEESFFRVEKFPTNLLIDPKGQIVMQGFHNHFRDFKRRMEAP